MKLPDSLLDGAMWRAWIQTVLIGLVGGGVFTLMKMPLGWMTGSMVFTTIAALMGMRVAFPSALRNGMVVILGLMIGATFTPETLEHAANWAPTLLAVIVFATLATVLVMAYDGLFLLCSRRFWRNGHHCGILRGECSACGADSYHPSFHCRSAAAALVPCV